MARSCTPEDPLVAALRKRGVARPEDFLADFAAVAREALAAGEEVNLRPLGILSTRDHEARVIRNPRTAQPHLVPARRVAHFSPGLALRNALKVEPGNGGEHGRH